MKNRDFCPQHERQSTRLPHGRYDSYLAPEELAKRLHRAATCDQATDYQYYSRPKMWEEAATYGVDNVEDLTDEQYDACLRVVHDYYRKNPVVRHNWGLEEYAGPRNVSERHTEKALYLSLIHI